MFGTLQKLEITEELARDYAKEDFSEWNDWQNLEDQKGWVQTDWLISAHKDLERFNEVIDILRGIEYDCEVRI